MSNQTIKVLITGDFCPINRIEKLVLESNFNAIINDFARVFQGNDLIITDLECPLTESESKRKKIGPHQKAHPVCIELLKQIGVNLVAMANNHIMDYGSGALSETLELCRLNNIAVVGVGKTPQEAADPFNFSRDGQSVAVFNMADDEFIVSPDHQFRCNPVNPVSAFYYLKKAREMHDYIIVIVHAGNEFYALPSPRTKKLYRYLVDMGADCVISHHTHAFSGYEIYKQKPIFYGLGNFIYDWPEKRNTTWNKGYIVRLLLGNGVNFELIPLKQGNENPGIFRLNSEETMEFNNEIKRLNKIIIDDDRLEADFQKYCETILPTYDSYIEPYFGKLISALRKRGLFPKLMSGRKRLLLLNIIRCESHRDVLLRMLSGNTNNND